MEYFSAIKMNEIWDFPGSPVVRLHTSTKGGAGSIPGWGTKILYAAKRKKKKIK